MSSGPIKFDEFVLDCDRYELYRGGHSVRLEKIPMELLILLVGKDGKLVTREEIIEHVWGKDVFVDTEHGINTAVRKIRQALKDDPEQPRFIQTVTGKGYRFIAERKNGNVASVVTSSPIIAVPSKEDSTKTVQKKSSARWIAIAAIGICIVVGITLALNLGRLRDRIFSSNQVGAHSLYCRSSLNQSFRR